MAPVLSPSGSSLNSGGNNRVNLEADKFGGQRGQPIVIPLGPANLDDNVTALCVAKFTQAERLAPGIAT